MIIFDDLHAVFTTLKGVFGQKRALLKTKIKIFKYFYLTSNKRVTAAEHRNMTEFSVQNCTLV
jgi:hypothetical protein